MENQALLYSRKTGTINPLDKHQVITLLKSVNPKANVNDVYKDIIKEYEFKQVAAGIYSVNATEDIIMCILIDKTREDFINFLKKNNLRTPEDSINKSMEEIINERKKKDEVPPLSFDKKLSYKVVKTFVPEMPKKAAECPYCQANKYGHRIDCSLRMKYENYKEGYSCWCPQCYLIEGYNCPYLQVQN